MGAADRGIKTGLRKEVDVTGGQQSRWYIEKQMDTISGYVSLQCPQSSGIMAKNDGADNIEDVHDGPSAAATVLLSLLPYVRDNGAALCLHLHDVGLLAANAALEAAHLGC